MSEYASGSNEFAAFHAITGEEVRITATFVNGFASGGRETKQLVTGFVGDREISYVERSDALCYSDSYQKLYNEGFPVVSDVLLVPDRGSVLVPYVKADGSELYGKGLNLCLRSGEEYIGRNPKRDEAFLEHVHESRLPFRGLKAVARQARALASRATKRGIYLPHDPLELQVRPDNSASLLMVDIADIVTTDGSRSERDRAAVWNEDRAQQFVTNIREIRDHLSGAAPLEPFPF